MKWFDIEDCVFFAIILATMVFLAFIVFQSNEMHKCTKRGGTVVDTPEGWVCAKLERV